MSRKKDLTSEDPGARVSSNNRLVIVHPTEGPALRRHRRDGGFIFFQGSLSQRKRDVDGSVRDFRLTDVGGRAIREILD